jgi:hypothetical protein
MKNMDRVIFGCMMVFGLLPGAMACTTDSWNGGASGLATADSPPAVARVSEFCGLRLTGIGHVQDNNPDAHTQFIARFFALVQVTGSGQADLFVAYPNETPSNSLFDISFDGSNFDFDASGAGGGTGTTAAQSGWNLIEIEYNSGGTFSFWVNADATVDPVTGSFAAGSGAVDAVRLGLPNGLGGFSGGAVTFDDYESHSSTPVGTVQFGDANGDGNVNSGDTVSIINENLGDVLASGVPDCNRDGNVNSGDTVCIINQWLGS